MSRSKITKNNLGIRKVVVTDVPVEQQFCVDSKNPLFKSLLKHIDVVDVLVLNHKKLTKFQKELINRHVSEMMRLNNIIIRELNFEVKTNQSKI